MALVQKARSRRVAIYFLLAAMVFGGVEEVTKLPSSIFPSVTFPLIRMIANVGAEPAGRMMPTVTRPLEEAVMRVPGIRMVRSQTSRGSSEIDALFTWGTNMQVARQRMQDQAARIRPSLPANTSINIRWMNTAVYPIQGYALTSKTRSQAQLLDLARYTLKPALIRIPGVSQVQIQGGRRREFQVRLNSAALHGWKLSAGDVVSAIKKNNRVLSAGLLERNHELYLTLVNGRVNSSEALSRISVPIPNRHPVPLSALGKITVADEVSFIRTTANGSPAVLVNIVRQPSGKTTAIANAVAALFKKHPDLLPKDVTWSNFYDKAAFVHASVVGTLNAILIGVLLLGLLLWAFLRNLRLTLTAVAAIPLTVCISSLLLGFFGQTINLMTMAGIAAALGLIADDAIVVIEHIEYVRSQHQVDDPAEHAMKDLLPALIGSSLSTIVILLPFSMLSGVVGAFFRPLAMTMAMALVVSFFLALVVIPMALPSGKGEGEKSGEEHPSLWQRIVHGIWLPVDTISRWLAAARRWSASLFVRHWWLPVASAGILIFGMYWFYGNIGSNFLPHMDEGSIIMDYWTPPGTSLTDTNRMLNQVGKVIMSVPAVSTYSRRTGTQLGFFITEPNRGDYVIKLKPRNQRPPITQVMDILRKRIATVEPAVHTDFGQILEDNIGDLTGGTPQPVDVKIFGSNLSLLHQKARAVAQALRPINGLKDVFDGIVIAGPSLQISVRPQAAARYDLTTEAILSDIKPYVIGTVADQIREGARMYDLRVLAPHSTPLRDVKIRTPSGVLLPLHDVATISTGKPEAEIDRQNLRTYIGVTARLAGRNLGGAMAAVRNQISQKVSLNPGMSIEYGGMYQQQKKSFQQLLLVLFAGLALVSVVVLFEFGDWRAPIVTTVCAVSVLSGVFLALILTGMTLNISSYVGAIMMVGIVGENAIFVINEAKIILRKGEVDSRKAWIMASQRRLRPVAMTILATSLALAPLAMGIGQGSQLMRPLAIAVIGGFILSGPAVLLILPGLYHLLGSKRLSQ